MTNLSKQGKFTQDELQALSIWDAPDVFTNATQTYSKTLDDKAGNTRLLTAQEIDEVQKQAFTEAFSQGKEAGFQEGKRAGFEEGKKLGYAENQQLLQTQAAELNTLLNTLTEPFKDLDEKVEQELVKLAMSVANQIIRREIKTDPGQVIAAVREAIAVLPLGSQSVTLHLHPEDVELVNNALSLDEMSPAWKLVEEPLLSRGGCKVVTETSAIDASVENRIAAVVASVLGDERDSLDAV